MSAAGGFEVARLLLGPVETNCYLACDLEQRQAVVIDPAWDGDRIGDELDRRKVALVAILITHAHFDHIAGCGRLQARYPAPIRLHAEDLPLWLGEGGAAFFGLSLPALPSPAESLQPGERIACGRLGFAVLHLPGHTPGHVGFLERERGWLFSGDVIFAGGIGRTDLPGGDYAALMASIRSQVLALPAATQILPGHGPPTTVGHERQSNPFLSGRWPDD